MRLTKRLYSQLLSSPAYPPETGGILGGNGELAERCVRDICTGEFDVYTPNTAYLNQAIAVWSKEGTLFMGVFHTHPEGCRELSYADIRYITAIMQVFDERRSLFFPIVIPQKEIIGFRAEKRDEIRILRDEIQIEQGGDRNGQQTE